MPPEDPKEKEKGMEEREGERGGGGQEERRRRRRKWKERKNDALAGGPFLATFVSKKTQFLRKVR